MFLAAQRGKTGGGPRLETDQLSVMTLSDFLKTPGTCWNWEAERLDACQEGEKRQNSKKLNNTKGEE